MKRIYSLLPANVVKRVRAVLEFDGGVADTHVSRAGELSRARRSSDLMRRMARVHAHELALVVFARVPEHFGPCAP